jgi:uncharacterized protein YkwD
MGGAHKFAMLPLMAGALFAFGCGIPMAPEYVAATSTAEAIQQRQNTDAQLAGQGGPEIRTASTDGSGASALASTPLPTREAALSVDEDGTQAAAPESTALAATATAAPAVATAAPAPVNSATFTQDFVGLLNALRAGRGLGVVTLNGALTTASNTFASYMGSSNFFGHYGPDGSAPRARLTAAGYRGAFKGEALSAGQATPQAALNALLASPPHQAILLDASAVEIGVGYAYQAGSNYGHYWVVVTGTP